MAEIESRKLSESLKESREAKLFRKQKRTESQQNLMPNTSRQALLSALKQPHLQNNQPPDIIEVLTGIINIQKTDHNSNKENTNNHHNNYNTQAEEKAPPTGKCSQGRAYLKTDIEEKSYL